MNIAEKIIAYRKNKNLTQSQLADLLFVSDKTVSKWETGRGYPEISILPKLASVLGTTVDDLLKEDETVPSSTRKPELEEQPGELPPSEFSNATEATEERFVLPRSKSLIVWIGTVFIPMGLFFILSVVTMLSGYYNAFATGLSVLLANALSRGIIALTLFLSFKNSRALMICAIYAMVFNTIGYISNLSESGIGLGLLEGFLIMVVYLISIGANVLIILFSLRKIKRAIPIVVLLWVGFGFTMVLSLLTFRTDFALNSLNDVIMILVSISTVIGFTRLYPRFEMRRVPLAKQSTFFKDPA